MNAQRQVLFDVWREQDEIETAHARDVPSYTIGRLTLVPETRRVVWKGRTVRRLTERFYHLVDSLARRPDIIFTREMLLDLHWEGEDVIDRAVDTTIKNVRNEFRYVDSSFNQIVTRYGLGYFWSSDIDNETICGRLVISDGSTFWKSTNIKCLTELQQAILEVFAHSPNRILSTSEIQCALPPRFSHRHYSTEREIRKIRDIFRKQDRHFRNLKRYPKYGYAWNPELS